MKIYDISMVIKNDMMVYKNKEEKKPYLTNTRNHECNGIYESTITMDLHTGTHMDAPFHVLKDGKTVDQLDLSKTITKCKLLDLTYIKSKISKVDLENKGLEKGDFVLLKTQNSLSDKFSYEFIYLDNEGAQYLKDIGVKGVGIDALGIEREQPNHPSHHILLSADIIIIEGLRLKEVVEGIYTLIALPLNILGGDGSPLRAVLLDL